MTSSFIKHELTSLDKFGNAQMEAVELLFNTPQDTREADILFQQCLLEEREKGSYWGQMNGFERRAIVIRMWQFHNRGKLGPVYSWVDNRIKTISRALGLLGGLAYAHLEMILSDAIPSIDQYRPIEGKGLEANEAPESWDGIETIFRDGINAEKLDKVYPWLGPWQEET